MSFEYDPQHEDVEGCKQWSADQKIRHLQQQLTVQAAEIKRYVTEIDSMVVHQEYEAAQIDDLRTECAAKDAELAAQAAEIERLTKSDRVNALRAKSAEALFAAANIQPDAKTCDCCTQVIPSVQYYEAAGYLCEHCASKVLASRESVRLHLQREAELAAEIERLTKEVKARDQSVSCMIEIAAQRLQRCSDRDAELAALRSQLEEQRKRLEATEKLVNMFAQLPSGLPDLPTEPGWIEFRRPREGLPHWRAQKCDFAGGPVTERLRADSFTELALVVDDANWLTPHAEKDGGE